MVYLQYNFAISRQKKNAKFGHISIRKTYLFACILFEIFKILQPPSEFI